ncbi:Phosphate binding protein [uncultured Desulfatiglans sp.]|nr:Phosphate binding protein [uncultured Desulfatiglans sp.]
MPLHNLRFLACIILCAGILLGASGCAESEPDVVRIYGSTTTQPVLERIVRAYSRQSSVRIEVVPIGSHKGIEALVGGQCEIAASSVPATDSELGEGAAQYREFVFGYDMVVPIVHPRNPLRDLSLGQLRDIFSGKIERWSQLGGADLPIVTVNRSENSGTHDIWNRIVASAPEEIAGEPIVVASNSAVAAYVATHPEAIGYISSGFVNDEIRPLSIDGIEASIENARSKRYPVLRRLLLYTSSDCLTWEIKSFIIYLLSDEGQSEVRQAGFVPVDIFG